MAKGKTIGIKQVEMFCGMIEDKFQPVKEQHIKMRKEAEEVAKKQAAKQLGIADMIAKRNKLKQDITDTEQAILKTVHEKSNLREKYYCNFDNWLSDTLTKYSESAMEEWYYDHNPNEIYTKITNLKNRIKLATVGVDITNIFDEVDKLIQDCLKK